MLRTLAIEVLGIIWSTLAIVMYWANRKRAEEILGLRVIKRKTKPHKLSHKEIEEANRNRLIQDFDSQQDALMKGDVHQALYGHYPPADLGDSNDGHVEP